MNTIPSVKHIKLNDGETTFNQVKWIFSGSVDDRVVNEAYEIRDNSDEGIPIYVHMGDDDTEAYRISVKTDMIEIFSDGAKGAFYALQTLKFLLSENNGTIYCQEISDAPDMKYRGFYHDVTRGKIPTLETLKELVDTMASFKMNSLQLYIEHTFEFEEYKSCREKLGYLTKDEIKELGRYCNSKFIELIPSVSTFGHLYHLLSQDRYKHLSELPDYVPKSHYMKERMFHHTINPELDESFEVVKSLLDQYLEVTTSNKFNICCDETFDLGTGVNSGKDKSRLYIDFVKKIAEYLISKGKTVMMWGDILLQHPECINELPQDMIFLNWSYVGEPNEEQFRKIYELGKKQIICPGTNSWNAFAEDIVIEEGNITRLAEYANKFNAVGLLNTNWGDLGHVASILMSSYGLILGAAISWNGETKADERFRETVSKKIYGCSKMIDIISEISSVKYVLNWYKVITGTNEYVQYGCIPNPTEKDYIAAINKLKDIIARISVLTYSSDEIKKQVINAAEGFLITACICAKLDGYNIACDINCDKWLEEFSRLWLMKNKPSELEEIVRIIKTRI